MTPKEQPIVDAEVVPEEPARVAVRDGLRKRAWEHHRFMLLLAVGVLAGSAILGPSSDGRLKMPLGDFSLPNVCAFRRFTGLDCPSCGLTRCFVSMSRGDFSRAFVYHPVGVAVFFAVVAQLPYRAWQLGRLARGKPELRYLAPWVLPMVLLAAMFVQWLFGIGEAIHALLDT